jgi:hypothetical protein
MPRVLGRYALHRNAPSRCADDGSAKAVRFNTNVQLVIFASGTTHNADLTRALNIAAPGLALMLGVKSKKSQRAAPGKARGRGQKAVGTCGRLGACPCVAWLLNRTEHRAGIEVPDVGLAFDAPTTAPQGA